MNIHRILISGTGRSFVQQTATSDVHTQYGMISADAINDASDGEVITTQTGEQLVVFSPSFIDRYKRIRRGAQIITFKDAGIILATAGLHSESVVGEAGSGSGALTAFLAQHCRQVYSFDINKEHQETARLNCEDLGFENVDFALHDVTQGLPVCGLDCLVLDMPEPWNVLEYTDALKVGAYVVCYVPSTVQLQQVRHAADAHGYLHVRSVEVTERHWMVRGDAVRPTSRNTAFTAFLVFLRWLGPKWGALRPPEKQRFDPALPSEKVMQETFDS